MKLKLFFYCYFFSTFCLQAQTIDADFQAKILKTGTINAMQVQSDGKILIGGDFSFYNEKKVSPLLRLNPDGSIDETFQPDCEIIGEVNQIKLLDNGNILVDGGVQHCYAENAGSLVRLFPDGKVDASFKVEKDFYLTTTNGSHPNLSIQPDGKIFYVGGPAVGDGLTSLYRLNEDGSRDMTFQIATPEIVFYNHLLLADGSILVCGGWWEYTTDREIVVIKYLPDGTVDSSFSVAASFPTNSIINEQMRYATNIVLRKEGFYTVFGESRFGGAALLLNVDLNGARINKGADLGVGPFTSNLLELGNGALLISMPTDFVYLGDGGLRFMPKNEVTGRVTQLQKDSLNHILLGGDFATYKGQQVNSLAVLKPAPFFGNFNKTIDTIRSTNSRFHKIGIVEAVNLLEEDKILIGGEFDQVGTIPRQHLAKLNADGSLDTTFNTNEIAFGSAIKDVKVLSNGKILISGWYDTDLPSDKNIMNGIIQLNADGSVDETFKHNIPWNPKNGRIAEMAVSGNGKIYLGNRMNLLGYFNDASARIFSDGTLDTTYFSQFIFNNPRHVEVASTEGGKIFLAESGFQVDGIEDVQLVRLLSNDEVDNSFTPLKGLETNEEKNAEINALTTLNDGQIMVGGNFSHRNGMPVSNGLLKLTSGGLIDSTFQLPILEPTRFGPASISLVFELPDSNLLIHGNFSSIADQAKSIFTIVDKNGNLQESPILLKSGFIRAVKSNEKGEVFLAGKAISHESNEDNVGLIKVTYPSDNVISNQYDLRGRVQSINGEPLAGISLQVIKEDTLFTETNSDGEFALERFQAGSVIEIQPLVSMGISQSISTFDALLTQKHILNTQPFDSPYQYIAADLNQSGSVTVFDIILQLNIILGKSANLPNFQPWRFVLNDFEFADDNPIATPIANKWQTSDLNQNYTDINFTGIEIGDVSGATSNARELESRQLPSVLPIQIENQFLQKGSTYSIPFKFLNNQPLAGFQLSLQTKYLQIKRINGQVVEKGIFSSVKNHHWFASNKNQININWLATKDNKIGDFELLVRAEQKGYLKDLLQLNQRSFKNESYTDELEIEDIGLNFQSVDIRKAEWKIKISPNPIRLSTTLLTIENTPATNIWLRIYNAQGQLIHSYKEQFEGGLYQQLLAMPNTSGTYWAQVQIGNEQLQQFKIIKL